MSINSNRYEKESVLEYEKTDPDGSLYEPVSTKKSDLTYLVGAKCTDGIVIVSDSRLITDEFDAETGNKILQIDEDIVIGATGDTRAFHRFMDELSEKLDQTPIASVNEVVTLVENIIFSLNEKYGKRTRWDLKCFIAVKDAWKKHNIETNNAKLFALGKDGFALPIHRILALGHAEYYGAMFLRILWDETYTMRQTAQLVKFILDTIHSLDLDLTVDHRLQYFCIPYNDEPKFALWEDFEIINKNLTNMVEVFNKAMSDIKNIQYEEAVKILQEKHPEIQKEFDDYKKRFPVEKRTRKKNTTS